MSEILRIPADDATDEGWEILGLSLSITDPRPVHSAREERRMRDGWDFRAGDPEIYANEARLVVPGGQVLDLGMGGARSSLFFAMHGMEVHGIDRDQESVDFINEFGDVFAIPITSECADITEADFGEEQYDVVVLSQVLVHFASTDGAYNIIAKAIRALKPGGNLYLRAVGSGDEEFQNAIDRGAELSENDSNVYYDYCCCSGDWEYAPSLFFDPVRLMTFIETNGMQLWHTQVAPETGHMNVMYSEDWHVPIEHGSQRQMITLIGRKRGRPKSSGL